jgi:hypothetical protein
VTTASARPHVRAEGSGIEAAAVRAMQDIHALNSFGGMNCLVMDAAGNTMSATTVTGRESIHWYMDTTSNEPEKRIGINVPKPQ